MFLLWVCESYCLLPSLPSTHSIALAVNPSTKLDWFDENMPEKTYEVKKLFIQKVNIFT
jgi:hypothetical protein